ncbi:MAG: transporter substrate-binding domain-containing protein [Alphaproteobacteria bacterium]|nr:MAG: transporter substrate-binding domain-containing protein [Alphaproteobacteria bacterium]
MKQYLTIFLSSLLAVQAQTANAADVKVAVPVLSGHFDATGDGRSAAALRATFRQCKLKPQFVPTRWGQHWQAYEQDKSFDAVAVVWDSASLHGFTSDAFIHQQNGVAMLADSKFKVRTISDLKGMKVLGFGGATEMFPSLATVLPDLKSYWEAPSGFSTTQALVNGDVDAFITDGLIFAIDYMVRVKTTGATYGDTNWPKVKFVGLFPANGDYVTFRSKDLRDRFNTCLAAAQESGAISMATHDYVLPYKDIVGDQIPPY